MKSFCCVKVSDICEPRAAVGYKLFFWWWSYPSRPRFIGLDPLEWALLMNLPATLPNFTKSWAALAVGALAWKAGSERKEMTNSMSLRSERACGPGVFWRILANRVRKLERGWQRNILSSSWLAQALFYPTLTNERKRKTNQRLLSSIRKVYRVQKLDRLSCGCKTNCPSVT